MMERLWTLLSKSELKQSPGLYIGCQINISLKKGFSDLLENPNKDQSLDC